MANTERLKVLQKAVLEWPAEVELNMADWCRPKAKECGTAMCAGGLACTVPEFKALGLRLSRTGTLKYPAFGDKRDYDAMEEFFGLSLEETMHIFAPSHYRDKSLPITPAMVAKHIQDVIDART